ncbi:YL1 and YL1 C domain containing protein [Trichuris trichiura]|uniref:Vacuolar protein sorting-associated protein 72 homolog n=1 Tax=Trichuris trichiura TaxID=36087 RepID=A0A077Z7K3_TRITR|nr:YL1 and YL1 C domain containing protein [Trichuris trichiura]
MSSRSRRSNAGGQMKELMAKLDVEEFYSNTYGGFVEDEEDGNFSEEEQSSASSESNIETDEEAILDSGEIYGQSEDDDEQGKSKRKPRLKIPVKYKFRDPFGPMKKTSEITEPSYKRRRIVNEHDQPAPVVHEKHLRKTTLEKSAEAVRRRSAAKRIKRHCTKVRSVALTQEERLDEARITEILNEQSLKRFCEFQLEEKKKRSERKIEEVRPPYVRFVSSMEPADPNLADVSRSADDREDANCKMLQNSVIFSDEQLFKETFSCWKKAPKIPEQKRCVIFGTPANYIDPFTQLPFSNVAAYKKLRELYESQLIAKIISGMYWSCPVSILSIYMAVHMLSEFGYTNALKDTCLSDSGVMVDSFDFSGTPEDDVSNPKFFRRDARRACVTSAHFDRRNNEHAHVIEALHEECNAKVRDAFLLDWPFNMDISKLGFDKPGSLRSTDRFVNARHFTNCSVTSGNEGRLLSCDMHIGSQKHPTYERMRCSYVLETDKWKSDRKPKKCVTGEHIAHRLINYVSTSDICLLHIFGDPNARQVVEFFNCTGLPKDLYSGLCVYPPFKCNRIRKFFKKKRVYYGCDTCEDGRIGDFCHRCKLNSF